MPGFDGTGPRGMGPMTGGGRGFCAVPLSVNQSMYRGRTVLPPYNVPWGAPYYGVRPFTTQMTREQELEFLKTQAQAMKGQLAQIEASIHELEGESGL